MGLFDFGSTRNTLVYLQNNGEFTGSEFSSSIFSCNLDENETESLFGHAINFIETHYRDYPIRWKDIMTSQMFKDENVEGEILGDEIRDSCFIIDDMLFKGGYVGGGKTGDKFVQMPDFSENHIPVQEKTKKTFLRTVCTFDNGIHSCDVDFLRGKLEGVRNYQKIMTKNFVKKDMQLWEKTSHRKTREIMTTLNKIIKKMDL